MQDIRIEIFSSAMDWLIFHTGIYYSISFFFTFFSQMCCNWLLMWYRWPHFIKLQFSCNFQMDLSNLLLLINLHWMRRFSQNNVLEECWCVVTHCNIYIPFWLRSYQKKALNKLIALVDIKIIITRIGWELLPVILISCIYFHVNCTTNWTDSTILYFLSLQSIKSRNQFKKKNE